MQSTLKVCLRILVFFTRCSLSPIRYTGRVNSPINVSRSDVVTKIFPSLSRKTLHMVPSADSSWAEESQLPSLPTSFLPLGFPRPRMGAAVDDFSAALVSTAEMVHCRRKP